MNIHRLAVSGVIACASSLPLAACSVGLITVRPAAATFAAPGISPAASAPTGQAGPGSASPSALGGMNFQMMTTSGTAKTIPVIAWGLFTAAGTDHESKGGGDLDVLSYVHTFAFPGGTFQVRYEPRTPFVGSRERTCLATESGNGTYTLSGGTGKYRRISGSGHFTLNIVEIQAKVNGACSTTSPPVAFQEVITASGPVKLP